MDPRTLTYYSQAAQEVAHRYEQVESTVARFFAQAFTPGGRVLDVGAGSGRDLATLIRAGYQGFGIEPVDALREQALIHHPELAGRLTPGALPDLGTPFDGGFDGILCSAVLMHVPADCLQASAHALRANLRTGGRLLLSLPLSRPDVDASERDGLGRLFKAYDFDQVVEVLGQARFRQLQRWNTSDALGRAQTTWYTLLMEAAVLPH